MHEVSLLISTFKVHSGSMRITESASMSENVLRGSFVQDGTGRDGIVTNFLVPMWSFIGNEKDTLPFVFIRFTNN
jgi:hypothetical protein